MMQTRLYLIERLLTQIYGGVPTDDAEITNSLVNTWINDGLAVAAKQNYKEAIQIDGTGYVNNSFYCTYSGLPISTDPIDEFLYTITLPHVPIGIAKNEGVAMLQFTKLGFTSQTAVPLSINQVTYQSGMRRIPNKILYWPEGDKLKVESVLLLNSYTATVKMISAGDSTDLNSVINVPQEYYPILVDYVTKMLMMERSVPQDLSNDAIDNKG